jgi:hypothetical protein
VYGVAEGPPDELDGWGKPLGTISDADTDQSVQLNDAGEHRYFLLWITDLTEAAGGYGVEVGEIGLTA